MGEKVHNQMRIPTDVAPGQETSAPRCTTDLPTWMLDSNEDLNCRPKYHGIHNDTDSNNEYIDRFHHHFRTTVIVVSIAASQSRLSWL